MRQGWGGEKEREGEEGIGKFGTQKNQEGLPGAQENISEWERDQGSNLSFSSCWKCDWRQVTSPL